MNALYIPKNLPPEKAMARRRAWADRVRTRKRPRKRCRKCFVSYPNMREFFAPGPKGNMSSTCIKCAHEMAPPPPVPAPEIDTGDRSFVPLSRTPDEGELDPEDDEDVRDPVGEPDSYPE